MPLPSFLQRLRQRSQEPSSGAVPMSSADIEVARVRARRRLIGMVVLVGCGVIGFPWLFETQPRPMSADVQVVAAASGPRVSGVVVQQPAVTTPAPAIAVVNPPAVVAPAPREPELEEPPVAKPAAAASKATPQPARAASKPVAKPVAAKPVVVASAPKSKASAPPTQQVAKAAADGADSRFVVQVGAFTDVATAREVRLKVERLGIKTYTQVVTTEGTKKIRVRVGPYTTKAEADKAAAALRKAGLSGAVLTL